MHRDLERLALLGWALYPCSRTSRAGLWKGSQGEATSDLNTLALWARDHPWLQLAGGVWPVWRVGPRCGFHRDARA